MKKTILTIAAAAVATSAFAAVPDISIANKIGYAYPGTATIDGTMGSGEWDAAAAQQSNAIDTFIQTGGNDFTPPTDSADLSGEWWAMWDNDALYVLISVNDETFPLVADAFEIYTSTVYSRFYGEWNAPGYDGASDMQAVFAFDGSGALSKSEGLYSWNSNAALPASVEVSHTVTETGYLVEVKLPWAHLLGDGTTGVTFQDGMLFDGPYAGEFGSEREFMGFDIHLQDNDAGEVRQTKVAWNPGYEGREGDNHWADTEVWGTLVFVDDIIIDPCDVTDVVFASEYYADLGGDFIFNWSTGDYLYTGYCPFVYSFGSETVTAGWLYIDEASTSPDGFFVYDFGAEAWKFCIQGYLVDL